MIFYLLAILFLQLQETLHKVIFYKVFKVGIGSTLKKQLDPENINADNAYLCKS